MKVYTDRYGRWHDQPTDGLEHSSDRGFLCTAVAKRLGVDVVLNERASKACALIPKRHPHLYVYGKEISPMSRDEILGLAYLGYFKEKHLKGGWSYCPFSLPALDPIALVKQLCQCVGKKKGFFWKNNLTQMYHLAFRVPLQDRHFLLSCWGRYNAFYHLVHIVDTNIKKTNRFSRLVRFLKTGEDKAAVKKYFGEDHPLSLL